MKRKKMFILDLQEILISRSTIDKLKLSEKLDIEAPVFDVDKKIQIFTSIENPKAKTERSTENQRLI
jgi:hypothetical protein